MNHPPPTDLTLLARELMSGHWTLSTETTDATHHCYALTRALPPRRPLSTRERQVLTRALRGESNKAIAFTLGVGASAVSTWLTRARRKLAGGIPEALLSGVLGVGVE